MKKSLLLILLTVALGAKGQDLKKILELAVDNNPGLQARYKEFEAAMTRVSQVNSLTDPTLSLGYFISPVETRVGPQQMRFSLTQMFPWFGTLKERGDIAALEAEAIFQNFLDARNKLEYEVVQAYYPIIEIDRLLSIESENRSLLLSFKRLAERKFESGDVKLTDILRLDMMIRDSDNVIDLLEKKRSPLLSRLKSLLDVEYDSLINISDSLEAPTLTNTIERSFDQNPEIGAIDFQIEATSKRESLAQKEGLPQIGLGLDYVIVGEREDFTAEDNGQDVFMPMVSVGIPIFRKKYNAAKKEAQIQYQSYQLQRQNLINQLSAEYDNARYDLERNFQDIALFDQQIKSLDRIRKLLLSDYQNGEVSLEEVLEIHQRDLMYRKEKVKALVSANLALARLNYITANDN